MTGSRVLVEEGRVLILDQEGKPAFEIIPGYGEDSVTIRSLGRGKLAVHPEATNAISLDIVASSKGGL